VLHATPGSATVQTAPVLFGIPILRAPVFPEIDLQIAGQVFGDDVPPHPTATGNAGSLFVESETVASDLAVEGPTVDS
jgi:hypothetical protein